jgi:hypothetical protein
MGQAASSPVPDEVATDLHKSQAIVSQEPQIVDDGRPKILAFGYEL